jgi:hypothetical protein
LEEERRKERGRSGKEVRDRKKERRIERGRSGSKRKREWEEGRDRETSGQAFHLQMLALACIVKNRHCYIRSPVSVISCSH